ncbi:von Willebrand factor type A domain-containing protein [Brevibacillus reuszeri]|uniref:vWA domain-containing protein n=1 Tax=Brevibacillus reuszeri TaxID=54915 RepID=UPI00366FE32E
MKKMTHASGITILVASLIGCSAGNPAAQSSVEPASALTESMPSPTSNQAVSSAPSQGNTAQSSELSNRMADYAVKKKPAYTRTNEMYFQDYGTNPFVSTAADHLSTFAADVDTGSYTVMRSYVRDGSLPPPEAVRVEEFINYFPSAYPAPEKQTFAIVADGGPSPFYKGTQLVRIGIKGKEITAEQRKPAKLVFVIDVSGSMDRENRLELVKKSLNVLLDQLQPKDTVGIVVYGSQGRVLLPPTSIDDKHRILAAIGSLTPEDSTNVEEGLTLGYEMASRSFERGAINRIILCSDGVANVGETGARGILRSIEDYARKDIYLSTFGFGMGNYNDVLMEQLADKGQGNYAYIDSFSEARRVFTEALTGTLQTIARDVKIQVEFDPKKVEAYRLLGYENRDVRDEDFRNDKTDAGEVGAGHSVTALYEVKLRPASNTELGTVRIRYHDAASQKVEEVAQPVQVQSELAPDLKFLAAAAQFAEILRKSPWAEEGSLRDVLDLAKSSAQGEQELEFVRIVKDSLAIRGR